MAAATDAGAALVTIKTKMYGRTARAGIVHAEIEVRAGECLCEVCSAARRASRCTANRCTANRTGYPAKPPLPKIHCQLYLVLGGQRVPLGLSTMH
jgi:hypothetical protein